MITVLPSVVCLVLNLHHIIIIIIIIIIITLAVKTFMGFGFLNKVIPSLPLQHHFFPVIHIPHSNFLLLFCLLF